MISTISGKITEKGDSSLVIEISGFGLEVFVNSTLVKDLEVESEIKLFTHFHIREDAMQLYGFVEAGARDFFRELIKVSGVGPRIAMEILESPIDNVKRAILDKNIVLLTQIKGLGKKIAQKIIIELESKISEEEISLDGKQGFFSEEIVFALQNLGFRRKEIFERLQDLPDDIKETEEIVRWFLKK